MTRSRPRSRSLAVDVELGARREVDLDDLAAEVEHVALLGDRPAAQPPGAAGEAEPAPRGEHRDVEPAVVGIDGADPRAAAEVARDRHDRLPAAGGEDLVAVRSDRALERVLGRGRPQRADRVGERAEPRLERLGPAGGDRRQPGRGDVHERAPVGEAAELERPRAPARGGELRGRLDVVRQPRGAREVVRGSRRDHGERDAEAPRGSAAPPMVPSPPATTTRSGPAARPLEVRGLAAVDAHGRPVALEEGGQRLWIEPAAGGPVGDERHAHLEAP